MILERQFRRAWSTKEPFYANVLPEFVTRLAPQQGQHLSASPVAGRLRLFWEMFWLGVPVVVWRFCLTGFHPAFTPLQITCRIPATQTHNFPSCRPWSQLALPLLAIIRWANIIFTHSPPTRSLALIHRDNNQALFKSITAC